MTDLSPPPSAKSPGRWLKVALAVSLALNLAVAGTVAGVALRLHDSGRPDRVAVRDLSFGPFTEALTREQRRTMLRGFIEKGPGPGPGLREMRAQMRGDFDAVLTALRAIPFDATAFRAAVEGQSNRIATRAEAGRDALVTLVLQMSDADRAAYVDRLEKAMERPRENEHRDGRRSNDERKGIRESKGTDD
ncbi:MAG: periplasmic heavy metal sensor [Paracoccaceae bacterium]